MARKFVILKTTFPATHHWPGVPSELEDVQFLKHPHRHVFHVTVRFVITHLDRDIEFINKKNEINRFIQKKYYNQFLGAMSCEAIAFDILTEFDAYFVAVLEDNENGGEIYAD